MAYIGTPPQSGFITTAKQRVTSSTNNYVDLDNSISSLADVIVWVNSVKQDSTNLTLTTSTRITLGDTLTSSDVVEIAYLGKAVATQTPDTGTVTNDMLAGSIANSKLANSSITLNGSAVSLGGSATVGLSGWSNNGANNDLLPASASAGIYLGVNSATAANLLADYEEGNWTPNWDAQSGTVTGSSSVSGNYIKIGKAVMLQAQGTLTTSGASGYYKFTNAPFQANGNFVGTGNEFGQTGTQQLVWMDDNSTQVNIKKYDGSIIANPYLRLNIFYFTD